MEEKKEDNLSTIKVKNFDITTPLDFDQGMECFGGQSKMYFKMITQFEDISLNKCMKDITKHYEEKNHKEYKESAH